MANTDRAHGMAKHKAILIACPQYLRLVRGTYECDESGRYPLDEEGNFMLYRVRCGQHEGRCMQTLCALHRYNRMGKGSWYPVRILAAPEPENRKGQTPTNKSPQRGSADKPQTDVLA
jgi:hypothetical protein